jgi:short-subunit dehydrogenase
VDLTGANVVVTGGSRGIGLAIARLAVERGGRVGLVARRDADLARARRALGSDAVTATADVTDRTALEAALDAIADEHGPTDVLVASAGIGAVGSATDVDLDVLGRLLAVNLVGVVHSARAVVPAMRDRGRGHVVVIGSIAGRLGVAGEAAYSSSKFAVTGFVEALALEVRGAGVGVSLVSPGAVSTDFFASRGAPYARRWPRPVTAERVARAAIRAVERDRFDVVVPAWLRVGIVARAALPGAYRRGAARAAGPSPS